jgi:hypothetical protein
MRKFAFPLQRMLGFKRSMYEKERNTLAQMRAERAGVQMRRDNTERQVLQRDAAFRKKAAGEGVRFDEVASAAFHRDNADKLCRQLDRELEAMDEAIARQLEVVMALDKEVKSLEKLRERQWDEYVAETARAERDRILELVSGRYAAGQAEAARAETDAQSARRHGVAQ